MFVSALLVFALLFLVPNPQASATAVLSLTIQELTEKADLIVVGRCEEIESRWDAERKRIFTYVTIVPKQCLKNGPCTPQIRIRNLGGTVGNVAMRVAGTPTFKIGERVFLFLSGSSATYYELLGLAQGKFSIFQSGNKSYVERDMSNLTLVRKTGDRFRVVRPEQPEKEELEAFIGRVKNNLAGK